VVEAPQSGHCSCGADLPPNFLSCPACHRLVHGGRLRELVSAADAAEADGDIRTGLTHLRDALDLLPEGSRQREVVRRRVQRLSDRIDSGNVPAGPAAPSGPPGLSPPTVSPKSSDSGRAAAIKMGTAAGAFGLILWKFKFIVVFLATKAKLLLLGLSKSTTLFSMLLSLGVYWTAWGWRFAAGLVLSIYVHEMGHVAALRHFGIRATAPMFLPGLGAVVRLHQYPQTPREDARVGLAGPLWGLGASAATLIAHWLTQLPILAAIGSVGAWINLFNLVPFWQLDGARGFRALSRQQRWLATAVIAATWAVTGEGLLALLLIAAAVRCFAGDADATGDGRGLATYSGLVISLALLSRFPVPA
jgi:Zn-dependent protease